LVHVAESRVKQDDAHATGRDILLQRWKQRFSQAGNERSDLPMHVELYQKTSGHYPASVYAETIYRTLKDRP
jgi:hypothetical protein